MWTVLGWTAAGILAAFAIAAPFLIRWLDRAALIEALVSSVTCQRCHPGSTGTGECTCTDSRKCGHPACSEGSAP